MSDLLAAAQAALSAGRRDEAVQHLSNAIAEDPNRPASVYRALVLQLYNLGRFAEGEAAAGQAAQRYPRDFELLNLHGVLLRKLRRFAEAAKVLDQAVRLNPKALSAQQNLGNVLLDLGDGKRAEAVFAKLARLEPRNPEFRRQLGRALWRQRQMEPALTRLRQATAIRPDVVDPWLDLASLLLEEHRTDEAEAAVEKALSHNPGNGRLLEAQITLLRRTGQTAKARQRLEALAATDEAGAWVHRQLGAILTDGDREAAHHHLQRAVALEPGNLDTITQMIENRERTRSGDEGANIEEAYQQTLRTLPRAAEFGDGAIKIVTDVLSRVCDFDAVDRLADFTETGRTWAKAGRHAALMKQMPRVASDADRLELVEQHRMWGGEAEAAAARSPIRRAPARPPGQRIRLGLMSSDLRQHPVGYFAFPLFDHLDRSRFEVFVYSYYQGADSPAQRHITERATAYNWWPDISTRDAAQRIANDDLDMLVELGGSTHMNKLSVMAYRPAPRQASWLGYPHSAGLSTIDYFVCDPYIAPPNPELLIEKPLMLKNAWYPLSPAIFRDQPACDPTPPAARNGYATFGTANQPYKYSRAGIRAWARVMEQCANSRFLFIRPEGSSASFRANLQGAFAAEGIAPERIEFEAVRGAHLPHYNRIDISLDTFPQTGGTTTCESMWMGAPCVSLVGPAPYERLSYSVLMNTGLGDLAATSVDSYVDTAVKLAHDVPRLASLRAGMRDRMRASPLGQTEAWARDFYDVVEAAVRQPA